MHLEICTTGLMVSTEAPTGEILPSIRNLSQGPEYTQKVTVPEYRNTTASETFSISPLFPISLCFFFREEPTRPNRISHAVFITHFFTTSPMSPPPTPHTRISPGFAPNHVPTPKADPIHHRDPNPPTPLTTHHPYAPSGAAGRRPPQRPPPRRALTHRGRCSFVRFPPQRLEPIFLFLLFLP